MQKYIKIHPADKVAVALCPLAAGTEVTIENQTLILTEDIPQGHNLLWKICLKISRLSNTAILLGLPKRR